VGCGLEDWTPGALRARMSPQMPRLLSRKERLILEIVRDEGDPHVLEVVGHYHRRSGEPLEPTVVISVLQALVRDGLLRVERRPAPEDAPFEERVHFLATDDPAPEPSESDQPLTGSVDTSQLLEIVELVLRESPELKLAARVAEHSKSA
jgi:hypothetical protein